MIHSTVQDITDDIPLVIAWTRVYNPPTPFTAKLIVLLVSILDTDNEKQRLSLLPKLLLSSFARATINILP
jgi:hypothetical protein